MKRRFLILTMMMAAVMPALAQGPRGSRGGGAGGLDFLVGYLALSDTQKTQAEAIFDAAQTTAETPRGQLTSARDALKAAVKANQSDAQLDQLAAAVGTIEGRLEGINAKASAKFYALLTADQKLKYDQLRDRPERGSRP